MRPTSKWEQEAAEGKKDRLDGLTMKKVSVSESMEDFIKESQEYSQRESQPGKKRVRWADVEEKRLQSREREMGFVVGHTNWERVMDDQYADKALNRTKYF